MSWSAHQLSWVHVMTWAISYHRREANSLSFAASRGLLFLLDCESKELYFTLEQASPIHLPVSSWLLINVLMMPGSFLAGTCVVALQRRGGVGGKKKKIPSWPASLHRCKDISAYLKMESLSSSSVLEKQ